MAANPCEAIERPKTVSSQPLGLSPDDIKKLLAVIPKTPTGSATMPSRSRSRSLAGAPSS
jgi:hypothetical protein